jgi:hypothetical protein
MAAKQGRLPNRFPAGAKYVVESRGALQGMILMHRYVELPDGRRIDLVARLVPACTDRRKASAEGDRLLAARSRRELALAEAS